MQVWTVDLIPVMRRDRAMLPRSSVWALLGLMLVLHSQHTVVQAAAILPNGTGAWFGSAFQVNTESVSTYVKRVGFTPAFFNVFVNLPLDTNATAFLRLVVPQLTAAKAGVMITATPNEGLAAVTESAVSELAFFISQLEQVSCPPPEPLNYIAAEAPAHSCSLKVQAQ